MTKKIVSDSERERRKRRERGHHKNGEFYSLIFAIAAAVSAPSP